jgi:hypothetical protein
MKTLRYQIWEGRKCMESISDFSIVDHPISLMFHLLVQLDFVEMAFCLSLDEMAQRTALDVKRFVMSVGLEDLDERETLLVLSGIFLQNP